jgi:hypothetical protein
MPSVRTQLLGLALGRLAIGAALIAKPTSQIGSSWVGDADAARPTSAMLFRSIGARDVALALGTLGAQRTGSPLKPWLLGATFADAADLVATFAAGKAVPAKGRVAIAALAGGAIVQQLMIARTVES